MFYNFNILVISIEKKMNLVKNSFSIEIFLISKLFGHKSIFTKFQFDWIPVSGSIFTIKSYGVKLIKYI